MKAETEYDLVVWGATGFAGARVAQYLAEQGTTLRWALGGRSREKLEKVRAQLPAALASVPLIVGDARDVASLDAWVPKARVVASTVGPFATHGKELAAACARHGTHYCDLTGETTFVRWLIDHQHETAVRSGACLVPCSGFDSIPSDLGVWMMQQFFREKFGAPAKRIQLVVEGSSGGVSGGTMASMLTLFEEAAGSPEVRALVQNPYALDPDPSRKGPETSDSLRVRKDDRTGKYAAYFPMAAINARVVRRSNALLGDAYGRDFSYDEVIALKRGPLGYLAALGVNGGLGAAVLAGATSPGRALMRRVLPKPGEGPSVEALEKGFFKIGLNAEGANGEKAVGKIRCQLDPGYRGTALMLSQTAMALLDRDAAQDLPAGIQTPAAALGQTLLGRLRDAGMEWSVA